MASTSLATGPFFGVVSGAGSSDTFTSIAGQPTGVRVKFTRAVQVSDVTLLRSADGGSTWSAVSTIHSPRNVDPATYPNAGTSKTYWFTDASPCLYKINNASSGVLFVVACSTLPNDYFFPFDILGESIWLTDAGDSTPSNFVGIGAAKLLSLCQTMATPLTAADISGALTLYKLCRGGVLATLSVPSGVERYLAKSSWSTRMVRVASATVTSLVDMQGNSVNSATPLYIKNSSVTYSNGSSVTATDVTASGLSLSAGVWGIHGFTTMIEAATLGMYIWADAKDLAVPTPNLAVLGL